MVADDSLKVTLKPFLHSCGMEINGCWNGPISPLHAAGGSCGRSKNFECVVVVVEPSGNPTRVPYANFVVFVPGVFGVRKCIVAPESNMPNTMF